MCRCVRMFTFKLHLSIIRHNAKHFSSFKDKSLTFTLKIPQRIFGVIIFFYVMLGVNIPVILANIFMFIVRSGALFNENRLII